MSRVSDRMIGIWVLVQGIIISVVSVYAPQYAVDDSQLYFPYDSLISVIRKLSEKEMIFLSGNFNGHEINSEDFEDQHVSYSYGVSSKEGEKILGFFAPTDTTIGNPLFKVRACLFY